MFIFSDGAYRTIPEFSWGNLQPRYVRTGDPQVSNVGLSAFSAQVIPGRLDKLQALVEAENFSAVPVTAKLSLYLDDKLLDAAETTIEPGKTGGADFAFDPA